MAVRQIGIIIRTTFEGIHHWPACPHDDVSFLRSPHRHTFHVECRQRVEHTDRQVEIIRLKREVDAFLATFRNVGSAVAQLGTRSCEDVAELLLDRYGFSFVQVLEDGENGGYCVATDVLHVNDMVRPYCFVGTEAEGPHQGDRVLFVGGSVEPAVALDALQAAEQTERIEGVYYGAGNDHDVRQDTYESLAAICDPMGMHVTVETRGPLTIKKVRPSHLHVSLVESSNDATTEYDWLKFRTDDALVWRNASQEISTPLDDERFSRDMRVR